MGLRRPGAGGRLRSLGRRDRPGRIRGQCRAGAPRCRRRTADVSASQRHSCSHFASWVTCSGVSWSARWRQPVTVFSGVPGTGEALVVRPLGLYPQPPGPAHCLPAYQVGVFSWTRAGGDPRHRRITDTNPARYRAAGCAVGQLGKQQRARTMAGDDRGIYGEYPPAVVWVGCPVPSSGMRLPGHH